MEREIKIIKCPYCQSDVEMDVEFAKKNGRIFCGGCCKAFDVQVREEKPRRNTYDDVYFPDDGW